MDHIVRLTNGQDLKESILKYCLENNIHAGCVICAVGCLNKLNIRLATAKTFIQKQEEFEIVSLMGTISNNKCHIHIAVSDVNGNCFGGHLLEGCIVNTTCELIIHQLNDDLDREFDPNTGYNELVKRG